MEHDEVTGIGGSGDELEQLSGRAGADDEQSVVNVDQAEGIGDGVMDRLVTDAVAASRLRAKADGGGLLPVCTRWWDDADVGPLFSDAQTRARVEREQHQPPLSYFEGTLPVPQGWDHRRGAHLAFGETYATERGEAARRRWPVTTLPGTHLHLLTDPDEVATELLVLIGQLGVNTPKS